ncbi:tetratricopeptide repeat protein [Actinokineospora guangxiensis]|uniref:Tetratricopeptide repeat protein n=1 Tax=Actinokineospora guangxiensis TaxID=1490288 RepID=A0ABW0EUG6_9PSEU
MEFRVLGPVAAEHGGAPVPLGDQQQRFVLVVLLLHANKPVSTERLAEIVWSDAAKRDNVRTYINRIRKAVGVDSGVAIETTSSGYLLRIADDQLDAAQFERLRERANAEDDPRRAIELLRAAVGLWRGRFLEDIDIDRVGGTAVFDLDVAYRDTVGDLAELELGVGDHRSARDRLRRVHAEHPDWQRHAELLMRALVACGDGMAAIRVFRETAAALDADGYEPGPVLRNLAARAERGVPACSLPSRPAGFTGRDAELAVIAAAAGAGRAVWVSGAPGVGKTGLAVEAAHRLRERYPDGQILVRLNGFTPNVRAASTGDALTQLLGELGVPPEQIPATDSRKIALYQAELYGTRTLVVLDNAESAEQVRALLPDAPDCLAIVTSRHAGEPGSGEHVRLAPLPPPQAAALFRGLVGDPLRLRGRDDEVDRVVGRCGYLPMPIRVAAALLRRHVGWPLEHLVDLLREGGPWQDGEAAVQVSYEQLGDQQRGLFELLGHLPGPDVDVAGAAALAGRGADWARKVLDELHEVSLLEEVTPERYLVLDPLKEFAVRAGAPGGEEAVSRLLDFYVVTLTRAVGTAYPFDESLLPAVGRGCPVAPEFADAASALAWIAAERDNLVAAIHGSAGRGMPEPVWRLAVLLWRHFNTANRLADWVQTLELARDAVGHDLGRAHVLLRLATAHNRIGRLADAVRTAEEALPLWRRVGDPLGEAATLCALATPTAELGETDRATGHFETALAKYAEAGDLRGQAHALSMLGYIDEQNGAFESAARRQAAAVPMLREIAHTQGLAHVLNNLGSVRQRTGDVDAALADHTEAHELAREVGDDCVAAYALNYIANAHRCRGRLAEAVEFHRRAKAAATHVSDPDLLIQLHHDRAATALARTDLADALRGFQAALDLSSGTGNRTHQANAHRGIARTLHALRRHADGVAHWRAAHATYTVLGHPEAAEVLAETAALTCPCQGVTRAAPDESPT